MFLNNVCVSLDKFCTYLDYLADFSNNELIRVQVKGYSLETPVVSCRLENKDWYDLTDEIQWSLFCECEYSVSDTSLELSLVWYDKYKFRKSSSVSIHSDKAIKSFDEFAKPSVCYDLKTVGLLNLLSCTRSFEEAKECLDLDAFFISRHNIKTLNYFISELEEKIQYFTNRWVGKSLNSDEKLLEARGLKALLNIVNLEEQSVVCFKTLMESFAKSKSSIVVVPSYLSDTHLQISYVGDKLRVRHRGYGNLQKELGVRNLRYQVPLFIYDTGSVGELFYEVREDQGLLYLEFLISSNGFVAHYG